MTTSTDIALKFLTHPILELLKEDKDTWGNFDKRAKKVDFIIDEYTSELNLTKECKYEYVSTMEEIKTFFTYVRKYLDPSTLEKGDYNVYDVYYINNFKNFKSVMSIYNKAVNGVRSGYFCNEVFYEWDYTNLGNCRDCGAHITLNYAETKRYKRLMEFMFGRGKQFHWPTRCQCCKMIKKNKKRLKDPKYDINDKRYIKANIENLEHVRQRNIKKYKGREEREKLIKSTIDQQERSIYGMEYGIMGNDAYKMKFEEIGLKNI